MKILIISSLYPTVSDPDNIDFTRALHHLVKYWNQQQGVQVQVVRPVFLYLRELIFGEKRKIGHYKKKPREKIFSLDNVSIIVYPVFKIPRIAYFYYPLYRFLDKYLKSIDFEPDIVAAHYDKSLHIGHQYSRRRNLPLVSGLHITPDLMTDDPKAFTMRWGKILAAAAAIACRSNYIYNKIAAWFPQYLGKSFIAYSGIEENLVEKPGTAIQRMKEWKNNDTLSIITVSSLMERKKIDTNLKALAKLKDRIDWTYTIIGDGELRPRLEPLTAILEKIIFQLQENQLENILVNAHHTIKQYTDKNAARNYLDRLNQVAKRSGARS